MTGRSGETKGVLSLEPPRDHGRRFFGLLQRLPCQAKLTTMCDVGRYERLHQSILRVLGPLSDLITLHSDCA
jgi:hypothetical protein